MAKNFLPEKRCAGDGFHGKELKISSMMLDAADGLSKSIHVQ